mmetsp:Transcript_65221/g.185013  ORF Transcript_65221/g.185013 Transcript_65221/m.185013 type:complete len:202 (+) Transcript_65221:1101-1706(+)
MVDDVLPSRLAEAGVVGPQLLQGLDGPEVAQVGGGLVAHDGDHVGDAEICGGLKTAACVHEQPQVRRKALLVDRGDPEPVLQPRELCLRGRQHRCRRVEEDGFVQRASLVRVRQRLLDLVKVEFGQLRHHLPNVLLLKLHSREGSGGHRRSRGRCGRRSCLRTHGSSDQAAEPGIRKPGHPEHDGWPEVWLVLQTGRCGPR